MRKTLPMVAALAVLLLASLPIDAAQGTRVSGSYLIGSPAAYAAADACAVGATNKIDSSCAPIPQGVQTGRMFTLAITDTLNTVEAASVCFYGDKGFLGCNPLTVPRDATKFSVSSMGGVQVAWTVTFY